MIQKLKTVVLWGSRGLKKRAQQCIIGAEIGAACSSAGVYLIHSAPIEQKVAEFGRKYAGPKYVNWETAQNIVSGANKQMLVKGSSNIVDEIQRSLIKRIIKEDQHAFKEADTNRLALQIVNVGKQTGIDPLVIACIAKRETHFTPNVNSINGKGMMQVTSIAVQDIFKRTKLYSPRALQLTLHYKNPEALFSELKKNHQLNLEVGAILFQYHLTKSKGDLFKALRNYNGNVSVKTSNGKEMRENYARAILRDIQKYKKLLNENLLASNLQH